jgi:hypothetical protein
VTVAITARQMPASCMIDRSSSMTPSHRDGRAQLDSA